jgi:hypothetical protein
VSRVWNAITWAALAVAALVAVAMGVIELSGVRVHARGWLIMACTSAAAIALLTWLSLHLEHRRGASDLVRATSGLWIGTMALGGVYDTRLGISSGPEGIAGEAEINLGPRKGLVKETLVGRLVAADSTEGTVHLELAAVSVDSGPAAYQGDHFDLRFHGDEAEGTARGEEGSGLVARVSLRRKRWVP